MDRPASGQSPFYGIAVCFFAMARIFDQSSKDVSEAVYTRRGCDYPLSCNETAVPWGRYSVGYPRRGILSDAGPARPDQFIPRHSGNLWLDEWVRHRRLTRYYIIFGISLLLVIIGIHLLAVRTGLVLFYLGTVATFIFNKKFRTRQGIGWMVLFGVLVGVFLFTFPTIREKWAYFLEDFRNYESHSWWFYSDAVRWKSNLVGWEVFKSSPWWGVGMGDLIDEMHLQFYLMDNIRIREYPHN